MKNTENKIKKAFETITPDILDSVIRDSGNTKGTVVYMKKKRISAAVIAVAAAFVLLFGAAVGVFAYIDTNKVSSVVLIDVNPSVEIKLNKNDTVVDVTALNDDGKNILGDMKLVGSDIETALNAIVSNMITNGYINELQNSILISVENDNNNENASLREKLNAVIGSLLKNENPDCAVITQKVEKSDTDIQLLAEELGVSLGKAQIIKMLCDHNSTYTPESLACLNVNELTLLLDSLGVQIDGEVSGNASSKAYIGPDAAAAAAILHLNLSEETEITKQKVSLDFDDGIMVYEVEIITEQYEYEVEVNALNGEIVSVEKDKLDFIVTEYDILNEWEIRYIIAGYGIPVNGIDMSMELQRDDGYLIYEVEFVYDGVEYEFEIMATKGEVITYKTRKVENSGDPTSSLISEEQALEIAFAQAGVTKDEVTDIEISIERDSTVWEYEIEFAAGRYSYEVKVTQTGAITEYEREVHDKYRKLTLIGTTGEVHAVMVKFNPGAAGIHCFDEVFEPLSPTTGYVDGDYGDQSYNEWISKYTEEWFEENRLFLGDCIASCEIEIEGIYEKIIYLPEHPDGAGDYTQLLLVYNEIGVDDTWREEDGTYYGYMFFLELPKSDYPDEYFTTGFGRGSTIVYEDATKYY